MTTSKLELDTERIAGHAQAIRLTGAGVFQVLAFILIINSSGFIYGGKETWIVLFIAAATALAGFSLYRSRGRSRRLR
jgi:hypothetical protein